MLRVVLFFLNGNYNWLSHFLFLIFFLFHAVLLCTDCDCMLHPGVSIMMMSHGLLCDTCHAPFHRICPGCINAPSSCELLPWFPTESAYDARCSTYHCACSNTTCHQRSLRCTTYRQSGLAIYFTCWDLDYEDTLERHSICCLDWWETSVCIHICFLSNCHIYQFFLVYTFQSTVCTFYLS